MLAGGERPAGDARAGGAVMLHGGTERGFGNPAEVSGCTAPCHAGEEPAGGGCL